MIWKNIHNNLHIKTSSSDVNISQAGDVNANQTELRANVRWLVILSDLLTGGLIKSLIFGWTNDMCCQLQKMNHLFALTKKTSYRTFTWYQNDSHTTRDETFTPRLYSDISFFIKKEYEKNMNIMNNSIDSKWLLLSLLPDRIGIWKVVFCGGTKTGVPREKTLGAKTRTNNKLNPHMTPRPGIGPGPYWWEASTLTTTPSLLPPPVFK